MLRSLDEIRGYTLLATDGEIGRAKDFLFTMIVGRSVIWSPIPESGSRAARCFYPRSFSTSRNGRVNRFQSS
jgi:hypothetical protein